jgi:hypothetical protein
LLFKYALELDVITAEDVGFLRNPTSKGRQSKHLKVQHYTLTKTLPEELSTISLPMVVRPVKWHKRDGIEYVGGIHDIGS